MISFPVGPMKAVSGELPEDDSWAHEIKWDGMRIVAFVDPAVERQRVRLQSTSRADVSVGFPELAGLLDATAGRAAVLDGEVVAPDANGRPSFSLLQQRMHVRSPVEARQRAKQVPVVFQIFDLLSFDGTDAVRLAYRDRRELLERLVEDGPRWRVPQSHRGNGAALLDVMADQGMEGIVSKRLDSTYEVGRRSPSWRKIKVRRRQEFVVGGWASGEGTRAGTIGALLVGYHSASGLEFAGRVGTGFSTRELARLQGLLEPLARERSPFTPIDARLVVGARWVEPLLVCEVAFGEMTPDGRLRHPSYLGLRDDKRAEDVVLES